LLTDLSPKRETLIIVFLLHQTKQRVYRKEIPQGAIAAASMKDKIFEMAIAAGGHIPEYDTERGDALPTDDLRSAAIAIWQLGLEKIKGQISPQSFTTWFEPLVAKSLEGMTLRLLASERIYFRVDPAALPDADRTALTEILGPQAALPSNMQQKSKEWKHCLNRPASVSQAAPQIADTNSSHSGFAAAR